MRRNVELKSVNYSTLMPQSFLCERYSSLQEAVWIKIRLSCLLPAVKPLTTTCTLILPTELLGHGRLAGMLVKLTEILTNRAKQHGSRSKLRF